jgi:ubiquitin-conjugating enzyme E2 O
VTHPDWTVVTYPLERLTRLYDGIEQLEEEGFDVVSDDGHSHSEDEETWAMDEDGNWQPNMQDNDEWEDASMQDIQDDDFNQNNEGLVEMDNIISPSEAAQTEAEEPGVPTDASEPSEGSEGVTVSEVVADSQNDPIEGIQWKRFEISSCAPPDHAFFSSAPAQPSKSFLGRLTKEYRVLTSSLPGPFSCLCFSSVVELALPLKPRFHPCAGL